MKLQELIQEIKPSNQQAADAARTRWNSIAKPIDGLGLLEEAVVRLAGAQGDAAVRLERRGCVVMCADNGVVAEGVTQTGSEVTAVVTENFAKGQTSVSAMARVARCDILPVDIGVAGKLHQPGLLSHNIAHGTRNIAREPAMTAAQALDAVLFGAALAKRCKADGYDILATGEMGIGNTTTAGAVAAVLLELSPAQVAGRGAGLTSEGMTRKLAAIGRAIAVNRPDPHNPMEVLAKVGGFDLAGLTGVFLGGAACGLPVIIDGFISSVAALAALRLCPAACGYWLASHQSKEPAARLLLDALSLRAPLTAELCLGEGTGAVALLPLLDMTLAVYRDMPTFEEISIHAYHPQGKASLC